MAEAIDLTAKASEHQLDTPFYDSIRAGKPGFKLAEKFVVPPFNGKGFRVKKDRPSGSSKRKVRR